MIETEKILVSRSQFKQALKTLSVGSKGKYPPEMVFYCHSETLFIRLGGSEAQIEGQGSFVGQARLSGKALKPLTLALPNNDPLPLSRHPERLGFGNLRLTCKWEPHGSENITVAINADDLDYLRLANKHSFDEINKAGLVPKIEAATNKLNEQVMNAYDLLGSYGVKYEEIYALVEKAIQNKMIDESKEE